MRKLPDPHAGLEEARVDALGFRLDETDHCLDQLGRREHLSVVRDSLLRPHQADGCSAVRARWVRLVLRRGRQVAHSDRIEGVPELSGEPRQTFK